jgi:hypothetical protein
MSSAPPAHYGQQQPMYIKQGRPGGAGAGAAAGGGILGEHTYTTRLQEQMLIISWSMLWSAMLRYVSILLDPFKLGIV